jgi:hypothetical protein
LATANPSPKPPPSTTTRNPASFIGHVQMFWGCRRVATRRSLQLAARRGIISRQQEPSAGSVV